MAASRSQLYPIARQRFATAALDWPTSNIKVMLLAASYVPDFTNQFLSDVQAADSSDILATSANITNLAATNGYCTGDTTSFGVIESPLPAGYIIFYQDTGTPSTSPLICFLDTPDLPGLPLALTGLEYFIYKNLAYGGWFRL
jgi:hypothetical protein